jgi:hypothetical protein
MPAPDYEYQASRAAKVLGSRLIRGELNENTTLYGCIEFAQWSAASPDRIDRKYWYEVRFAPLGTLRQNIWSSVPPRSEPQLNRLHFSVLERTAAHPAGAASVARLGPIGHIGMEPRSIGLGTYLRDQLIDWVASLHPDASVAKGTLSRVDGDAANFERRNRFYVSGKFQIRVQDDGSGAFWADRLDGLRRHTENGNVVELAKSDVHRLLQSAPELEEAKLQVEFLSAKCTRLRTTAANTKARLLWTLVGLVALLVTLGFATARGKLSWHLF